MTAASEELAVARDAPAPAEPGGGGLLLVDVLAAGALAALGFEVLRVLDPFGWAPLPKRALVAVPFALLGPLGVGIERGRTERPARAVALAASLGAALGALAGLLRRECAYDPIASVLASPPWAEAALAALPPLLLGPVLVRLGTRLSRAEEPWRAAAREGPPVATPERARRIAAVQLPRAASVLAAPLLLALVPLAAASLVLIRCYQLTLSRLLPPQCRFEPSCSRYGFQAFWRHGFVKGMLLTGYRVLRCQPFCTGGHDPVPGARR